MIRLHANENIPSGAIKALRASGYDVLAIKENAPGMEDPLVLALAQSDARVLLTQDKDFAELVYRLRLPATEGVILYRPAGGGPDDIDRIVRGIMSRDDWAGHFAVISQNRIRIRKLPPPIAPPRA